MSICSSYRYQVENNVILKHHLMVPDLSNVTGLVYIIYPNSFFQSNLQKYSEFNDNIFHTDMRYICDDYWYIHSI